MEHPLANGESMRQRRQRPPGRILWIGCRGMVEKMMQRCVLPRHSCRVGQCLEPGEILLRDLVAPVLIGRIAIVHATTEWPGLPRGAQVALLKRTKVRRHRRLVRRRLGEQHLGFQVADEQHVAKLLEPATASARDAHRPGGGDLAINLLVEFEHKAAQVVHILMTCKRRVISSTGMRSPCPEPGQTSQVRSHVLTDLRLLSQKGHV